MYTLSVQKYEINIFQSINVKLYIIIYVEQSHTEIKLMLEDSNEKTICEYMYEQSEKNGDLHSHGCYISSPYYLRSFTNELDLLSSLKSLKCSIGDIEHVEYIYLRQKFNFSLDNLIEFEFIDQELKTFLLFNNHEKIIAHAKNIISYIEKKELEYDKILWNMRDSLADNLKKELSLEFPLFKDK